MTRWTRKICTMSALAALLIVLGGCAGREPDIVTVESGVPCYAHETVTYHIHAHLDIYVHGDHVGIPAGIGIRDECIFALHTHDATGMIHVESAQKQTFLLGQFFALAGWANGGGDVAGQAVGPSDEIRAWVDGMPVVPATPDNIAARPIDPHDEIVIEIGPPWVDPPITYAFPPGE